jgi:hypothetical protein
MSKLTKTKKQNETIPDKEQFIFNENYSHNMKNPLYCKRIFYYKVSFSDFGVWFCDLPLWYSLMILLIRRAFSIGSGACLITILDVSLAVLMCISQNPKIVSRIPLVCALTSCTFSSEHSFRLRESADICLILTMRVSVMIKKSSSSCIQLKNIKVRNTIQKSDIDPQNTAPPVIDIMFSLYKNIKVVVITRMDI